MGAAMHGIENICCLTGEYVTAGEGPEAKRAFDLDGPQLISVTQTLGAGRYLSGRRIEPHPHFLVGAVENPGAPPFISFRRDAGIAKLCTRLGIAPRLGRETNGYSASVPV